MMDAKPGNTICAALAALFLPIALIGLPAVAAAQTAPPAPKEPAPVEEVVVTGTRLPTDVTQGSQDVHIYDRERIDNSGQSTVNDFLNTLPEVSVNSVDNLNIGTTVRLRGAPSGTALVLINGRRTQTTAGGVSAFGFFDINMIPLALVERIEILPAGSSAIYGGDALAGVVNIILKSDFTGYTAEGGYKFSNNIDGKNVSAGAGWTVRGLNVTIMASHNDSDSLYGRDRDITSSGDLRRFGGPNLGTTTFGSPATVSSIAGNLPSLNSSFAAVPRGSTGIGLTPGSFAATAGLQNTAGFTPYATIVPKTSRDGIFASANYRVSEDLTLFAEFLASSYQDKGAIVPPFLQLMTVPASNPFNPFGTAVRVSGVVQSAEGLEHFTYQEDFVRPLIGARGNLGRWAWEATALYSHDNGSLFHYGQANTAALNAALASTNPATALNPFVDGPMGSPALLASIWSNTVVTNFSSDSTILDGFVRGPALDLPAGPLEVVFGSEFENSNLQTTFSKSREVGAFYTEWRAPLLSAGAESGSKRDLLALDLAGRFDQYSDFGGQPTWQAGVEARPIDGLLLRATHGTAFRPPTLANLGMPLSSSPLTVNDPRFGGATSLVSTITGGNANLSPTTGTTSTLGAVWTPREVPGLSLSLTHWQLRIDGGINLPSPQFIVDNEALFPGRVQRDASGQILSVDRTFVNFGTIRQRGIDFGFSWAVNTALGVVTPGVNATYMMRFDGATTPGGAVVDRLSLANSDGIFAPQWKLVASLGWAPDMPFKLWFDGRYTGPYTDYTAPRKIGDFWYFDASGEVDMKRVLGFDNTPKFPGMKLQVSIINLTDKLPPFSTFFRGYDVYNYDILGRTIFLRLRLQT